MKTVLGRKNWNLSKTDVHEKLGRNGIIIVAIENFDELWKRAFKSEVSQSQFRKILENEPWLMLIASTLKTSIDENYDERLFKVFRRVELNPWDDDQHAEYLKKRAELTNTDLPSEKLHHIKAYSHFCEHFLASQSSSRICYFGKEIF